MLASEDCLPSFRSLDNNPRSEEKHVLTGLHEQYNWLSHARYCLSYNYVTTIANDVIELRFQRFKQ